MKNNSMPSRICFMILIFLFVSACLAGWLAPYSPREEVRSNSFHPPSKIHFRDLNGQFYFKPFVYQTQARYDENLRRVYDEDFSQKHFLKFGGRKLVRVEQPARLYFFGTDSRGRDLFSRTLYGARISLSLGVLGACLAAFVGLLLGSVSGYFGGKPDRFLMRVAEFFIMIPGFYLLLALRSALPVQLDSKQVYTVVILVLSMIGWGGMARVIRGMTLSIRENDFVAAAKVLGRSDFEILIRHVLPHTLPYLAVAVSVSVPGYILGESALSLLGLGIQEPDVSWGNLLTESLAMAHLQFHPWVVIPGLFIFAAAFSFNVLGNSLLRKD